MSDELDNIVDNLREPSAWIRIIFMVGFALVLYLIMAPIIAVLLIVQALFSVISGESNRNLRQLGKALGIYIKQIIDFLTYNSNLRPFPFSDFPNLDVEDDPEDSVASNTAAKTDSKESTGKPTASKKAASKKSTAKTAKTGKTATKAPAKKKAPKESNKDSTNEARKEADSKSSTATTEDDANDKKANSSESD